MSYSKIALSLASLTFFGIASANTQEITVRVNGSMVAFTDARPQTVNGRVLVPLRGVLEQIGADINWNEATQTVKAHMGDRDIELQLGSNRAQVNGETVSLRVPAMRIGGSTMVPLRFLGEALGASVDWNESIQTVDIRTGVTTTVTHREPQRNRGNMTPGRSGREIALRIDGHETSFGTARPYLRGAEVMVSLEHMASVGKFNYRYDSDENTFYVRGKQLRSVVGSRLVEKDGQRIRMETASEMHNGALYVPLEFIGLASDQTATWNANTRTILLISHQP